MFFALNNISYASFRTPCYCICMAFVNSSALSEVCGYTLLLATCSFTVWYPKSSANSVIIFCWMVPGVCVTNFGTGAGFALKFTYLIESYDALDELSNCCLVALISSA